jgi:hypothetical protein
MTFKHTVPTLLLHPTASCPRCDGREVRALGVNTESQSAWHERHEYDYLWAIPQGWSPHADLRQSTKRELL